MHITLESRFASHDDYLAWADTRPDEERYEIVEGYPVMSPGPGYAHQLCQSALLSLLHNSCPPGHVVLAGPYDWVLWELPTLQVREPDLLVLRRPDDPNARRLEQPPLLAVEILSPSSVEIDLFVKRRDYGRAGLEHYWVVDPTKPQVAVYHRSGDELVLARLATGKQPLNVAEPFPVTFRPSDLLA